MRIAPKPVTLSVPTTLAGGPKPAGTSFLDLLAQVSSNVVQGVKSAGNHSGEQPTEDSDSGDQAGMGDSGFSTSQGEPIEPTRVPAANRVPMYPVNIGSKKQATAAGPAGPKAIAVAPRGCETPQIQSKNPQTEVKLSSNCIPSITDQESSQQLIAAQPSTAPVKIAGSNSESEQAAAASGDIHFIASPVDPQPLIPSPQPVQDSQEPAIPVLPAEAPTNPAEIAGAQSVTKQGTDGSATHQSSLSMVDSQAIKSAPQSAVQLQPQTTPSTPAQISTRTSETAGNDPTHAQRVSSYELPDLQLWARDWKPRQSVMTPIVEPLAQTAPAVEVLRAKGLSDAPANAQITPAEVVFQGNLAPAKALAQDGSPSKSSGSTNTTDATGQSISSIPAKQAESTGAGSVGDASEPRSSTTQGAGPIQHAGQSGGQNSTQAQPPTSQPVPLAAQSFEARGAQSAAFSNAATPESPSPARVTASNSGEAAPHGENQGDLPSDSMDHANAGASAGINSARLIQSISESEMRLGMRSMEFGDISIRTSVTAQQLQAQINVDHSELGSAISAHIPLLQAKLGSDFGINASVEVNQLGGFHQGGHGQASPQNQNLNSNRALAGGCAQSAETDAQAFPATSLAAEDGRLDIRV